MYKKIVSNLPLMLSMIMLLVPMLLSFPATVIRYQITSATSPSKSFGEGLTWFSDQFGMNALPCSGFGFTVPFPKILSGSMAEAFQNWQLIGNFFGHGVIAVGVVLLLRYLARNRVKLLKFFMMIVAYIGYVEVIFWLASPHVPECNPDNTFQLLSFVPYWPMIVLMVVTIFCIARSYFLLDKFEKQVPASA